MRRLIRGRLSAGLTVAGCLVMASMWSATAQPLAAMLQPGSDKGFWGGEPQRSGQGVYRNWEDSIQCYPRVLAEPTTVEEVQQLVRSHQRVRAAGPGHSYNQLLCSDDLMISTKKLNQVLYLDEMNWSVTTQSGIITRALLEWLGKKGYSLPTFPYFIDQSIGGAVSTGAHGSSLKYGTLSSILRSLKMVMADGSTRVFTPADGLEWDAVRTSVGSIGVIVELTLNVIPNKVVFRNSSTYRTEELLADIARFAADPTWGDEVNYWHFPMLGGGVKSWIQPSAKKYADIDPGNALSAFYWTAIENTPSEYLYWPSSIAFLQRNDTQFVDSWLGMWHYIMNAYPGAYSFKDALPSQELIAGKLLWNSYGQYDQYEWAVRPALAVQCFAAFFDLIQHDEHYKNVFRSAHLIRYVKAETTLLGMTRGENMVEINIDNYAVYDEGASIGFSRVKELFTGPLCQARTHFGKAGMHAGKGGAWSQSDIEYIKSTFKPEAALGGMTSYQKFAQIARQLDPQGKFRDPLHIFG